MKTAPTFTVTTGWAADEPRCPHPMHSPIGQEPGDPSHHCPACGAITIPAGEHTPGMEVRITSVRKTGSS